MIDTSRHHPDALAARDRLQPLSDGLYKGLEHGIELGRSFFENRTYDAQLFAHLVRYGILEETGTLVEVEPYAISRKSMCGVSIRAEGKNIRVLKKPKTEDEYLQPPGESERRQRFYNQDPQAKLVGTEELFTDTNNLVYAWELNAGGGIYLYLVKPNGWDSIWKPGTYDWAIPIEHSAFRETTTTNFVESGEGDDLDIHLPATGTGSDPGGSEPDGA